MSRQLIVTLVILACGLVPARLSGDRPARLRDSLKSNLLNRVDLERIERGYYEQLTRPQPAARRSGRYTGRAPPRVALRAPGRCRWKIRRWSCASTTFASWS